MLGMKLLPNPIVELLVTNVMLPVPLVMVQLIITVALVLLEDTIMITDVLKLAHIILSQILKLKDVKNVMNLVTLVMDLPNLIVLPVTKIIGNLHKILQENVLKFVQILISIPLIQMNVNFVTLLVILVKDQILMIVKIVLVIDIII